MQGKSRGYRYVVSCVAAGVFALVGARGQAQGDLRPPAGGADGRPGAALVEPAPAEDPGARWFAGELESVALMLSRHHTLPDREAFEAASPNVRDILLWWSTRADVAPWQRDRAMEALAYWYDAEIGAHWVAALSSADVEELMKHRIVRHLARHDAAAARPWLEQWLQEDDVQRRLTAVAALEALSPGMARALAEARLRVEVHELVRERLAPFVR